MSLSRLALVTLVVLVLMAVPSGAQEKKLSDSARAVLTKAEQLELLSLEPESEKGKEEVKNGFHGYKVLGSTQVKEADRRKQLVDALVKGIAEKADPARCFIPRHGIRASHGGKTVELVICFECSQLHLYEGVGPRQWMTISKSPEPVFDKVLKDAGIPKAK